ncbi:Superkiller protein 3 [Elasticomyces elasticus]|nr:Superkiller protein 3 [Elasticomyces elasticus]
MASNKTALKAAKSALDAGKYDEAITQAQIILASDSQNYFAKLFLGRASEKQEKVDDAAKAYESAAKIKPDDSQAWLGLCSLYEHQGSRKVDEYRLAAVRLAEIYAEADDLHRCQSTVDKLVAFVKQYGSQDQYKRALEVLLPTSSVYKFLEGRVQHPSLTYTRLAEITEDQERQRINKEIGERRTRLGARLGQVTNDVKQDVYAKSNLEDLYRNVIDWTNDDELRRTFEEKLLRRAHDTLIVLPSDQKGSKRDQVMILAHGMVIIKHPFPLAWELELEWKDYESMREYDVGILREFVEFFPNMGLSKVVQNYLASDLSPFPAQPEQDTQNDAQEAHEALSSGDRLLLITEGLDDAKESVLAHRLVSEYYLHLEEYESTIDTARTGLKLLAAESQKCGTTFQNVQDALNTSLATSLVHHQAPRNHVEALSLFGEILQQKPKSTSALLGVGLIHEEQEDYKEAIEFLSKALEQDPDNVRIGSEAAWCKALSGDYSEALHELEQYVARMQVGDPHSRELRAQTLYRVGVCLWELDPSKAARKDRGGAYARFLSAVKTNVNFAPAYASLGFYYADYAKDKKRARQCFQKAFELSASEVEAAERLARSFADQGDWDVVEVVAQRVVDSGKVRPPPGSKKKGISWPFSALGVVQMNRQEYSKAIVSFLSALRINPEDYHSYVGLGESYHNSGRYNSASRTFNYAENLLAKAQTKIVGESWFTKYMLANVNRELGEHETAISGLQEVLKDRPKEFGVSMALLQTFIEHAWRCIETGMFGQASQSANHALDMARSIADDTPNAFNLWKAVGDSCAVFSWVQSSVKDLPLDNVKALFQLGIELEEYDVLADIDGVGSDALNSMISDGTEASSQNLIACLHLGILAYKRAIYTCSHDIHAQAVAWYNLGWAEHRAYICISSLTPKSSKKYVKAAVRCFKRAIELEAGNADFWNALGVVTTRLNPKVAQHSFVRSLHLNERNVVAWTNLGTLYILNNDHELAHQAFARAQSTDPDYAHAWLGEGLIALLLGDTNEALSHFTHAFEIADSSSVVTKRQYAVSTFDHLISDPSASKDLATLIRPLFALQQLCSQTPQDLPVQHLAALFFERACNYDAAIEALKSLCDTAEADYEATESMAALARYARAKSDIARNQLAANDYAAASENAEMALDLSSDAEGCGLDFEGRRKLRLSAHLTNGLACYYLGKMDDSITMFRTALEESNSAPDVVRLLAQVLWARGGDDEKQVAREQLFETVEQHPEHVGLVLLLGVIAALDADQDTVDSVKDDLQSLRTNETVNAAQRAQVDTVLAAIAALTIEESGTDSALAEIQSSIMLTPSQPCVWTELADATGGGFAAEMALKTAQRAVPPFGQLEADELAKAFAGTGCVGDAMRAVFLAPWEQSGWESLVEAVGA